MAGAWHYYVRLQASRTSVIEFVAGAVLGCANNRIVRFSIRVELRCLAKNNNISSGSSSVSSSTSSSSGSSGSSSSSSSSGWDCSDFLVVLLKADTLTLIRLS